MIFFFYRGTVVTGRAERGKLKTGTELEILGYDKSLKSKVTGIEMFHKILEEANAGDQMGLLMRGIKRDQVRRGMIAAKPGSVKQGDNAKAQVYLMTKDEGGSEKPVTDELQLLVYSKTWDCPAIVKIDGKNMIMPGEDAAINLRLLKPMVLEKGQHFTLRSAGKTIGTGKVGRSQFQQKKNIF